MNRAVLKGIWCQSCRHEVVRSFVSLTGVSVPRYATCRSLVSKNYPMRTFSAVSGWRSDNTSSSLADTQVEAAENSKEHVPWYLREGTANAELSTRSFRQQELPELPENSPAILSEILTYSYKDLGLDDLKLIDLRGLDTPPAIGANVIMVIGTARSIKHLNVSADRLCRWLRNTYRLAPYADGLLGRNELKIKLRRKAKRARIASQAGLTIDDKDDGITTGWICVNSGVIKEEESEQKQPEARAFEGFGDVDAGSRIVVQMFIEEKREEVDLEGLWTATLERENRRKLKASKSTSPPVPPTDEVRSSSAAVKSLYSDHGPSRFFRLPGETLPNHRRQLHTTRRLMTPTHEAPFAETSLRDAVVDQVDSRASVSRGLDAKVTISSLFRSLSSLSDDKAREQLGTGPDDRNSTLFLQLFYDQPSDLPVDEVALAKLELFCRAVSLQHHAYSKPALWEHFVGFASLGSPISFDLGMQVVSAMLTERPSDPSASGSVISLPDTDIELALRVLDLLSFHGTDILNMDVFILLYQAAGRSHRGDADERRRSLARISKIIDVLDLEFDPEQARRLMELMFLNQDYDGFWKLWRKLPLYGFERTTKDYKMLFKLHIDLGDAHRARDCVLTWVPMMNREAPPIPMQGTLLKRVMSCIQLAEPGITAASQNGSSSSLSRIWNQCQATRESGRH
ncbi:hypothetical protein ASPZODRAFT_127291 [Penicilliopsis zonata CBS 506.65]|uniref:ATPase synthesis protein 25 n=1 Tax=Penicilliopsis zonata CBS 506.65 TaxID=1073090 RepID=A0A1L9SVL8_9EURO|nr:hypothetical protein ASPZODRAFT_127291 [Penicilliopsis zonata CBS 506.65]OJJ51255.1 hypothetical protein ASPZODRAFT_127291 [Penicilliopsis zonata CBS 506.65]